MEKGAAADPLAELRGGAYAERVGAQRGTAVATAGGWGR
jgi:hypothetical protein